MQLATAPYLAVELKYEDSVRVPQAFFVFVLFSFIKPIQSDPL